jgi:uncharacterized membrane protein
MVNAHHALEMLKSRNPSKRYEACEELRVAPTLPLEAVEALRAATADPDPVVADAARRAWILHANTPASSNPPQAPSSVGKATVGVLSWMVAGVLLVVWLVMLVGSIAANLAFGHEKFLVSMLWFVLIGSGLGVVIGAFTPRGWRNRMKQEREARATQAGIQMARPDAALTILRKRFVEGEITAQEYERIRDVLKEE